jgi:hypothetical protein
VSEARPHRQAACPLTKNMRRRRRPRDAGQAHAGRRICPPAIMSSVDPDRRRDDADADAVTALVASGGG